MCGFGAIFGVISRVFIERVVYSIQLYKNYFHTYRWKNRFARFGKKSILFRTVEILNPQNIFVGNRTSIQKHSIIEAWTFPYLRKSGEINIGDDCAFGEYNHITSTNKITIGNGVLTGRFVLITDNSHGLTDGTDINLMPSERKIYSSGEVIIRNNVWICDKVSILPGVTIGEGAIVAANAVVTSDVPAYSIAAGVPAKVIKQMK